ncbi:MAG: 16S rRNA (cytosine(967)-C(5))-methyltransferase RsmB [Oscillospiraceae bacterium]|nr:16S rRNA (cytosine(967)-C(5))-methyltransferase RsmB [Oscillospiraceae bacterium]
MSDARETAFFVLSRIEKDSAYANLVLGDVFKNENNCADVKFSYALVKGVLERLITLDYMLSRCLTQPIKKLKPQVLTILRLGAYQILFMDKVPVSAAVNESVKLAKNHGCAFASGLVNAVLRKISSVGEVYPDKSYFIEYLSVKYSFPKYICKMFCDKYSPECAEKIMASSLGAHNLYARYNTLKNGDISSEIRHSDVCENALILSNFQAKAENKDIKKGYIYIQDLSSQLCCKALSPQPGQTVIDVCAAPGGKSITAAQMMNNKGRIISCDIYEHKLSLIKENALRTGADIIETLLRDARDKTIKLPMADRILCDVPCSGLGVTGKKPEIKYKSEEDIDSLYEIQYAILENSARFLKKGGKLIYSTCTLNPKENIEICRKFKKVHNDFILCDILEDIECFRENKTVTVLPFIYGCDGFFIACFERI